MTRGGDGRSTRPGIDAGRDECDDETDGNRAMKRRIFGWISTVIGVVLALVAVELTAIAWLFVEDGRYTPAAELFQRSQNTYVRDLTQNTNCRYVDTLFPHPYLAFVHHANPPCGLSNTNNIGLLNTDFPTIKPGDRYLVLLTGGSVASQLAQNWPAPAPRYLEEELNKRFVSPNGKPFLVLNGGDGAWKQPQQMILFAMYATSVDAVVTVDGYNEHYFFFPATKERLERPLSNFLDVNPFVADENFGDAAIGWVIGRVAGTLTQMPVLGNSHAAYMIIRGIEAVAKSKDIFVSKKKTTLNSIFALPEDVVRDPKRAFQIQLGLYQKYTRAIDAIAKDNNLKSAFFLQPTPAWGKVLTEEEKRAAGDLSYAGMYREMVEGMLTLRDKGLPIYDLGDIAKDQTESLYADDIHFIREAGTGESKGYRIMATRVADQIGQTWNLKAK